MWFIYIYIHIYNKYGITFELDEYANIYFITDIFKPNK